MKNVRTILGHDLKAIFINPIAIAIVIGLIALPALFAGYAVSSLWDPYQNTNHLKVAVVNEDVGAQLPSELNSQAKSSSTSPASVQASSSSSSSPSPAQASSSSSALDWNHVYNLGDSLVEALAGDRTFDWRFVGESEAWKGLDSGDYYAVFVLPEDLTKDFFGVLTDNPEHPTVEYWANQKCNAMALQPADAGAGAIDGVANKAFADALSTASAEMAGDLTPGLEAAGVISGKGVKSSLQDAEEELKQISADLDGSNESIEKWRDSVDSAKSSLEQLSSQVPGMRGSLSGLEGVVADARAAAQSLDSSIDREKFNATDWDLTSADEIRQRVEQIATEIQNRQAEIFAATTRAEDALTQATEALEILKSDTSGNQGVQDEIAALEQKTAALRVEIQTLKELSATISQAAQRVQEVAVEVSDDLSKAAEMLEALDYTYSESTFPQISISLDSMLLMTRTLDSAMANIGSQADQARVLLDKLDDVLAQTKTVLDSSSDVLDNATKSLGAAQSNLQALANSDSMKEFTSLVDVDVRSYGEFAVSPAVLNVHPLFDLNSFGSGVTPFYASLALWVGCLMLIALIKLEPDASLVPELRPWEGYLGRALFLLILAIAQGLAIVIACAVLGVQMANPIALIVAVLITSFCFASIAFALSATFKHVGKALVALLLLIQVPLAADVFPTQLMPDFFQGLAPFMPFTYSMGALREAIGGFSGYAFAVDMGWLLMCGLVTFLLAVIVRPGLLNLNRLFDRKLAYADIFTTDQDGSESSSTDNAAVGEAIKDYGTCALMLSRVKNISRCYNALRYSAPLLLAVLMVALFIVASLVSLDANTKLALLGAFIVCIVLIAGLCVAFEFGYDGSIEHLREAGIEATTMFADQNTAKQGGAHEKRD